MLHPRSVGVTGPEVAFTKPLPRGRTFRIASAWVFDSPISDSIYYLLELDQSPFASETPVRLRLIENPSIKGDLDPQYYERVK